MTEPAATPDEPFQLDKLRELISMMESHGLTEVDLRSGTERWRLRRGPTEIPQVVANPGFGMMAYPPMAAQQHAVPAAAPVASAPAVAPAAAVKAELPAIKSPTVGTYYESAAPGEKPFVAVGSKVASDTIVCLIEAMKVFNQIPAEVNGTIAEILVKNGDPVDFGQPLFRVNLG